MTSLITFESRILDKAPEHLTPTCFDMRDRLYTIDQLTVTREQGVLAEVESYMVDEKKITTFHSRP